MNVANTPERIVVQKYGGSSLADPARIRAVAERVMATRALGYGVVAIVSAMGDTTDDLLRTAKELSPNPDGRELDMLMTAGERIAMALVAIAIRELGGAAISLTGSQCGIVTNDRHVDARIVEIRPFRVQDELARGHVVVIGGDQGVSYRREVTMLGRGGSDTTAVAMAAALGAQWCEICSDVDGVYTSDPRVVPAARRIPALGYEEAQELTGAGAKVLNAQAVEFAREHGIAIYARATASGPAGADPAHDGTIIRKDAPSATRRVVGIACEKDLLLLEGNAACGALLECLDQLAICGKEFHCANFGAQGEGFSLLVSCENLHQQARFRQMLEERFQTSVRVLSSIGAVSAVGAGINSSYQNVRAASRALAEIGIQPSGLSTTPFRISWLVPSSEADEAVRALHRLFIEATPEQHSERS
jgi:aspartate kinase